MGAGVSHAFSNGLGAFLDPSMTHMVFGIVIGTLIPILFIPIIEIIIVAVVNNKTVFGIFSKIISPTFDEPESLVKKVALPKSKIKILYIV